MTGRPPSMAGARFGILIGCTAWVLALGAICAATGRSELLLPVIAPLLLASFAMALLVLLPVEIMFAPSRVDPEKLRLPVVFGAVLTVCGLLLLLADGILVPALEDDPDLANAIRRTGGVVSVSRWVPSLLLLAGCVVKVVAIRRIATPRPTSR